MRHRGGGVAGGDNVVVRILVLGDSGAGKSTLIRRLVSQLGGKHHARDGTTVGAHLESVVWPASLGDLGAGARPVVVELVEVGGNRGFLAAGRAPFFNNCHGAILVYSEHQEESKKSLVHWFNELEANTKQQGTGADGSFALPPFVIVGTSPEQQQQGSGSGVPGGTRAPGLADASSATPAATGPLATLERRVPATKPLVALLDRILGVVFGVSLLVLSFVLLGPGRTIVPWAGVSAKDAIDHIEKRANVAESLAPSAAPGRPATTDNGSAGGAVRRLPGTSPTSPPKFLYDMAADASQPATVGSAFAAPAGATGFAYHGCVAPVPLDSERNFAAAGEALFDFIADTVRTWTANLSSVSSTGSR